MNKNAKKSKQLESIKKKLAAATAMLMVASTMMVSSTYAWFTLSTAPEVTGISTTVGANGNLEIALSNTAGDAASVTSAAGDSMATKDAYEANLTWGNLVDLANAAYGLDKVVLLPAELNEMSPGKVATANPLKYPKYGADGRVAEKDTKTQLAIYNKAEAKWVTNDNVYGVKAVGTVSGQSETVVAFREARAQLSQKAADAKNAATNTLVAYGDALGNIIVRKALDDNATFTAADATTLKNMITGLETAMGHIGEALKYVALGRAASAEFNDATTYEAVKAEIAKTDATTESVLKVFYGGTIPAADTNGGMLIAAYNKYLETKFVPSCQQFLKHPLFLFQHSVYWAGHTF